MSVKGYYNARRLVLADMELSNMSFEEDNDLWLFASTMITFVLLYNYIICYS